ncbi:MAG: response regulator [Candidatus Omnitrophica bacterium]|nr:response regulator [Candidatus Omnitrophota bacterium]
MPKKILIVDDEELVSQSLKKLLQKEGYQPYTVKNGREALRKIKEIDFDLLIVDVRMPQLDGIETIKRIREYQEKNHKKPIPEVLITGYADLEKYEEAKDLEVSDYLYKPFDNKEFLQIVKKSIG